MLMVPRSMLRSQLRIESSNKAAASDKEKDSQRTGERRHAALAALALAQPRRSWIEYLVLKHAETFQKKNSAVVLRAKQ